MVELVRCPFCGGKASEIDDPIVFGCSSCDVWEVDPEDWNERSLPAALDVVIAAVEAWPDEKFVYAISPKHVRITSRKGVIRSLEAIKATPTQPGQGQP